MPFNQLLMSYFYNSQKEEKFALAGREYTIGYIHSLSAGQYSYFLRIIKTAQCETGCMTLFLSAKEVTI
jgi:hypothetical protein